MYENEVIKAMETRRSVRAYKPDMVPQELIDQVIEAGLYAPSGMGRQSAVVLAVTDKKTRDTLSALNAQVMGHPDFDPFYGAPVVLVVLAKKEAHTRTEDGSLLMGNLLLAAHTLGLGSCWIHRAKEVMGSEEGTAILRRAGIDPNEYEGVGNCILGYAASEEPEAAPRREGRIYRV